jgi:Arc/MetJ-type ribon-helix-helix transcriptional regulator
MMKEQTFKLDESQIKFLQCYQNYGFKDASEVVRIAIKRLELALEAEQLEESAALYAEIYEKDTELQELTELGLEEWPKS